ncbi:MAG: ABC transporter ATP-binding protein [Bosea sp.]|nr:ABC transporter ATP-binding protein [Bosea sp. (in: a-proteobacteria)]
MADVVLNGVSKRFKHTVAVDDLSLTIANGEFVVLLGPTGVGKTTTLRLIAGLERADAGQVLIAGQDVTGAEPAQRDTTFVFQQYSLYPHLTVYDNLAFPLRSPLRKLPEDEIKRRVTDIARILRIEDKLANSATRLSGGQMQRVAIGRALVRRPNIYLMDEPLSSLDAKLRSELRLELKRIQQDMGATILYVTHDQIEAMTMASRIGVMEGGRLVQIGTPREIYENPASTYVATRLGQPAINLLPRALLGDMVMPRHTAIIGARTEHVRLSKADATRRGVSGSIKWVEHLGDQNHLHVTLGEADIVTLADPDSGLDVGDQVSIELARPLFFGADGQRIAG